MKGILLQAVDSLTYVDKGSDSTYLIPIFVIAILILIGIFSNTSDKKIESTEVETKDNKILKGGLVNTPKPSNPIPDKVHNDKPVSRTEIETPLNSHLNAGSETKFTTNRKTVTPYLDELTEIEIKVILSSPDPNKSEPKRIGYEPNNQFKQTKPYAYPIVLMPDRNSLIKFPRKGRSDKKGFKEDAFKTHLDNSFRNNFQVFNDRHLPTESGRPYEPDFCLINETDNKNIFINIEIDEPYDGWTRTPTHCGGDNDLRDIFFTKRGWIVIRFAEIQVHQNPRACCEFIKSVINSIFDSQPLQASVNEIDKVKQWDSLQSKKWARENYRERYLGIHSFGQRPNSVTEYVIESSELDSKIESNIPRNQVLSETSDTLAKKNYHPRDKRITFDPKEHRYFIDGNPDTISVTELVSRFFPEFDKIHWSEIKANERGVSVEQILSEWENERIDSADKGTKLHKAIEDYYNGRNTNYNSTEFSHFKEFKERYSKMIPFRSEWRVFDEDLMVAGTIDMVYKKENGELYMFDWKRSKKVVFADGTIRADNFQTGFGDLQHLGDNSYNKYCLQQNIYRAILEKRYGQKISSMNILVLHPIYDTYHLKKIPNMDREVSYIFRQVLGLR